jgi:bifunctional DNA-binding transcriptional regulator/antitoxin component of YhaV-PrlF toxin-antitoxin module
MANVALVEMDGELLLPIPSPILDRMKLEEGDVLEVTPVAGKIMVRPVEKS